MLVSSWASNQTHGRARERGRPDRLLKQRNRPGWPARNFLQATPYPVNRYASGPAASSRRARAHPQAGAIPLLALGQRALRPPAAEPAREQLAAATGPAAVRVLPGCRAADGFHQQLRPFAAFEPVDAEGVGLRVHAALLVELGAHGRLVQAVEAIALSEPGPASHRPGAARARVPQGSRTRRPDSGIAQARATTRSLAHWRGRRPNGRNSPRGSRAARRRSNRPCNRTRHLAAARSTLRVLEHAPGLDGTELGIRYRRFRARLAWPLAPSRGSSPGPG